MSGRRYILLVVVAMLVLLTIPAPTAASPRDGSTVVIELVNDNDSTLETNACTGESVLATGSVHLQIIETVAADGSEHVTLRYRDTYGNDEYVGAAWTKAHFDAISPVYTFYVPVIWEYVDGTPVWKTLFRVTIEIEDAAVVGGLFELIRTRCLQP